jgi:isopenicillin N synthase-like dioxygenase
VHRIVNVSEESMYSIPFFYHGNLSSRLALLDGGGSGGEETVEEHIKGRSVETPGSSGPKSRY